LVVCGAKPSIHASLTTGAPELEELLELELLEELEEELDELDEDELDDDELDELEAPSSPLPPQAVSSKLRRPAPTSCTLATDPLRIRIFIDDSPGFLFVGAASPQATFQAPYYNDAKTIFGGIAHTEFNFLLHSTFFSVCRHKCCA